MRADARAPFHRRETPLHVAAFYGNVAAMAALLSHSADVHAKDDLGCGGRSLLSAAISACTMVLLFIVDSF
jgi:hypothetical protein